MSIGRNAAWSLAGQVVFAAGHWGGLIVVARLGGPSELGQLALALAIVLPVMLFGGLQMQQLQVADAAGSYRFKDYFAVRLAGTLLAALALVIVALVYGGEMMRLILWATVIRLFDNLSEAHYGLAERNQQFDIVGTSQILKGANGFIILAGSYYLFHDLQTALSGVAATRAGIWWFFDRPMTAVWWKHTGSPTPGTQVLPQLLQLAWMGLPLGIALMLATLNVNVPRYFLEAFGGAAGLGLFAAMAHFVVAGKLAVSALSRAASPRMADHHHAGARQVLGSLLIRMMLVSALPGLIGLVVALLFGREILTLIYGAEFAAGSWVFPWIMLVAAVSYAQTPLNYGLTATGQRWVQPVMLGVVVAVNALGCLLLVPTHGMLGATLAWLASVIVQLAILVALHLVYLRPREAAA